MSKSTLGSKAAAKAGRDRYKKERARRREKIRRTKQVTTLARIKSETPPHGYEASDDDPPICAHCVFAKNNSVHEDA